MESESQFIQLISNDFLPKVAEIFQSFRPSTDESFWAPTAHLSRKLESGEYFKIVEPGFSSVYKIGDVGFGYSLYLIINAFNLQLKITRDGDFYASDADSTYISISRQQSKGMYIAGLKTNTTHGPRISGKTMLDVMTKLGAAMQIPNIFISDAAGVKCFWDDSIEIEHFSIMRVIVGLLTFYSFLPGHFYNEAQAERETHFLQSNATEETKIKIQDYLHALKTKTSSHFPEGCNEINSIIKSSIHKCKTEFGSTHLAVLEYVVTPLVNKKGGKRRLQKSKRKRRKSKRKRTIKKKYNESIFKRRIHLV